jgi:hypothetical protein
MSEQKECDACGFATAVEPYDRREGTGQKWLCQLCAATETGAAIEYPRDYVGQLATMQTICYVGNAILAAIERAQKGTG